MVRCDVSAAVAAASQPTRRCARPPRPAVSTTRSAPTSPSAGAKPVPLAEVSSLVTGVAGLRLAADAVLDLWQREDGQAPGDRAGARGELLASSERRARLVRRPRGQHRRPQARCATRSAHDLAADGRLVDAVRSDLRLADGRASATAVRMIWTGDHLDAARRLQATLVGPARAVSSTARRRASCWLVSVAWTMP